MKVHIFIIIQTTTPTNKQTNKHQVNQVKYRNKSEYKNRFAVALEVEKVNGFLSSQDPFIPLIRFSSVQFGSGWYFDRKVDVL